MKQFIILCAALWLLLFTPVFGQDIVQAKKMYHYERWKSARTGFEQAAGSNPEAAYWLVETLLQTGDFAEARIAAQNSLNTFTGNPLLVVAMGHVELFDGKVTDAKNRFENALSMMNKKNKVSILTAIGRAHGNVPLKNSSPDYGIEKLKQALEVEPYNGTVYIVLGDNYRKKLDGGGAVEAYTDAMSHDQSLTPQANYKIGKVYATQQNCEALTRYFKQSIAADTEFMPAYRELFENYTDRESKCLNFDIAKTYFDKYVSTSDQESETLLLLSANFAYRNRNYGEAIEKAKKLLISNTGLISLYKMIGYSFHAVRQYDSAAIWMEKYFQQETNPDNIVVHNYRTTAEEYELLGQFILAKKWWLKAAKMDMTNSDFYYEKAVETCKKMKNDTCIAFVYKENMDSKGPNAQKKDIYKVIQGFYNIGLYDSSLKTALVYSEKFPDDWRGPLWLGRNQAQIDSLMINESAFLYFKKFLAMAESDTTINTTKAEANFYLFGYSYNSKKDKKSARMYLEKTIELDPRHMLARKYLQEIYGIKIE